MTQATIPQTPAQKNNRRNLALQDLQPWLARRVQRWQQFMSDPNPGQVMVNLATWDMKLKLDVEDRPLESWNFPEDSEAFADHMIQRLRADIRLTRDFDDDRLPMINPAIGIALNSLYYADGDMEISAGTTWRHPVIHHWDDLQNLRCDENNRWFELTSTMNRRFISACDGDYCVQTFSHFGPMDMANSLRGNDLFIDLYDDPQYVQQLLNKSVEAINWLEQSQRKIVPTIAGGTMIWGTWVPGEVAFMSEDASDLCGAEIYQQFGRDAANKVANANGGAWIHHHAKGYQVHPEITQVAGLKATEISWDPNCPRPVDRLEELFAQNAGVPLMTRCTPKDVFQYADIMRKGKLMLMLTASSLDEAKEAINFLKR